MVSYVYGNTPIDLVNKINEKNIDIKNISGYLFNNRLYLCFYKVDKKEG